MIYYKNDPQFRQFRRELRTRLTPAEANLWKILKNSELDGRKFRRQYGIGKYVLDFYCPAERLAIELDGEGHQNVAALHYDNRRTRFAEHFRFESSGLKIVRYSVTPSM
jgi:very-short-patch-repair endonuclease